MAYQNSLKIFKKILRGLSAARIYHNTRSSCLYSMTYPSTNAAKRHKRCAWISVSQNIFTNLALEDWIYNNVDLDHEYLLVIWRNQPCVVIGCHQNPWIECGIFDLGKLGVDLARRRSGGGTVYHDLGNLNCTFFTSR